MTAFPPLERRSANAVVALAVAAAVALLVWQVASFWPYVSDDAFISLRYSQRFANGHGLTWNDGEYVEGYTNLLWVLASSLLLACGLDGLTVLRVLGAACTALAIATIAVAMRPATRGDWVAAVCAPLLLASGAPLLLWTCGGLEGPMVLWLCTWGTVACTRASVLDATSRRAAATASLPLALLCVTRSDGPLWAAAAIAAVAVLVWRRHGTRAAVRTGLALGLLPAVVVAGHLAFRLAYYGDVLPNTAYAKASASLASVSRGLAHLGEAGLALRGIGLLAIAGAVFGLRHASSRARTAAVLAPVALFTVYLVVIGGDHFPGYRMFLMLLGPLVLLAATTLQALADTVRRRAIAAALAAAATCVSVHDGRNDPGIAIVRSEVWQWEAMELAKALAATVADRDPLLALDAAGVMPYYSGLRCLDMLGLCDRAIAKRGPRTDLFTDGFVPGHMLGDGAYVLSRQPDLVQYHAPGTLQPGWSSARELDADPTYRRDYRAVRIDLPVATPPDYEQRVAPAFLWVKVEGRLGVRRSEARIEVPAWFLAGLAAPEPVMGIHDRFLADPAKADDVAKGVLRWALQPTAATPSPTTGRLVLRLDPRADATLTGLDLPTGRWSAAVVPPDDQVLVEFAAGEGAAGAYAASPVDAPGGPVALRLRALGDRERFVELVELKRVP